MPPKDILRLSKAHVLNVLVGRNRFLGLRGNRVAVGRARLWRCHFDFRGRDNVVEIEDGCRLRDVAFQIWGDENRVHIGKTVDGSFVEVHIEDGKNELDLGSDSVYRGGARGGIRFVLNEGTKLSIGRDCLCARSVNVRTGDGHAMLDREGRRLNPAADVRVGDHVWLGERATILKGVEVGAHCVVGADSVVTKSFPDAHCAIAGQPAKLLRTDVDWTRERTPPKRIRE